ncbi:MAG: sigma-54-dependent Fis family transcriptional regulator, partial [Planctomycetes bacterium]|nr:sigma-54-dependent Fis family transcriptional regulator [Planctomycetota bacterium]
LPEQLLESELFGHEEGAFTGATRGRRGAFEMAHEGTIFLDEIGEMPLQSQAKLLRVLQDFEVRRVGGERTTYVDVRVMAASNEDLEAESDARRFRQDLFYRLGVVTLTVPPLRERREDIPALVADHIVRLSSRIGLVVDGIAEDALDRLCRHNWPGNVRELINVIERGMLLCEGDEITLSDLPTKIAYPEQTSLSDLAKMRELPTEWRDRTLHEIRDGVVENVERAYLAMILAETGGQVGLAAQRAGIHSRGLYDKMRKYGLRKEEFREGGSGRD